MTTDTRVQARPGFRWGTAALVFAIPIALALSAHGVAWRWFRTGPVVQVERLVDLGVVARNAQLKVPIEIRNIGSEELRLSKFATSCPVCIFVNRRTDKGVEAVNELALAPGEAAQVLVYLEVIAKPGEPYEPRIWFQTNDPSRREVAVGFRATVRGALVCYPPELALGTVDSGSPVRRLVQVRDTGRGTPYRLSRAVVSGCSTLHARVRPGAVKEEDPTPAERFGALVAEVELSGTIPAEAPGPQQHRLELHEEGQDRPLVVPIRYSVLPPYEVVPPALVLPRMVNGSPDYSATMTIRVRAVTDPRQAIRVRELPPHVSVTRRPVYDAKEGGYTLEVRYDPPSGNNPNGKKMVIRIDVPLRPGTKAIDVPLTVWKP